MAINEHVRFYVTKKTNGMKLPITMTISFIFFAVSVHWKLRKLN